MAKKDVNERIAIIGGGPAGLSAAMYLEKAGYKNYVVYEKDGEVGGKCHSPTYNGKRYETGAVMGCDSYFSVMEVQEFCGDVGQEWTGPKLAKKYKTLKGKTYDPFNPKNPKNLPRLLRTKKQLKKIATLLETKYKGYDVNGHRGVASGHYEGFDASDNKTWISGDNENLKDLAMPFKDFCKLNGVEQIQDVWIAPFTAFGYGYFDEIPAAYVLKYLDFYTLMEFVKTNLWTWKDGTQSIWEHLNDKLAHPAVLNAGITKVERKDNKVYVTVNGAVEVFDDIIITAPLQYMDRYFDATPEEKGLFSKIDFERYDVLGCTIKEGKYPDISYYMFDNMEPKRLGHLMVFMDRWREDKDQVITTYSLRNRLDQDEIPYDECRKMVLDDMKVCGPEVDKIDTEHSWYYFPHIYTEDYANGWYDKVEAMQGQKNTYYAGEVMSFGDMEETAEYSKALVYRFF